MTSITFPAHILALAQQAKGIPLDFREYEDRIVIVFEDGRKSTFLRDETITAPQVGSVAPSTAQSDNPPSAQSKPKRNPKEKNS
jgi:hypothetical protein